MVETRSERPAIFQWSVSQRWKSAAVVLGVLAGLVVSFSYNPANSNLYPSCPFHRLTGFYCPGCGTLRALHQLFHGHLLTAFCLNPLTVLCLPFLGYSFLSNVMLLMAGRRMPSFSVPAIWIWILLGVIISFWVLRNIPLYPFSLLAP